MSTKSFHIIAASIASAALAALISTILLINFMDKGSFLLRTIATPSTKSNRHLKKSSKTFDASLASIYSDANGKTPEDFEVDMTFLTKFVEALQAFVPYHGDNRRLAHVPSDPVTTVVYLQALLSLTHMKDTTGIIHLKAAQDTAGLGTTGIPVTWWQEMKNDSYCSLGGQVFWFKPEIFHYNIQIPVGDVCPDADLEVVQSYATHEGNPIPYQDDAYGDAHVTIEPPLILYNELTSSNPGYKTCHYVPDLEEPTITVKIEYCYALFR
eukprot:scaffold6834_cov44-Cyclotella_meneghiniana.AAC.6